MAGAGLVLEENLMIQGNSVRRLPNIACIYFFYGFHRNR
jgi:hypothetical protein